MLDHTASVSEQHYELEDLREQSRIFQDSFEKVLQSKNYFLKM